MNHQKDIEKLRRFGKGMVSEEDGSTISSLFSENENNAEFKEQIKREFYEYINTYSKENLNLSPLLDRIHHTIHNKGKCAKYTVIHKIYTWYSLAAAVLLIPLLILGGIWQFEQKYENKVPSEELTTTILFAPKGSRISFTLPDGTEGWLNSGSSLEYQIPFSRNRHISMNGEAWFHVAEDKAHPFEIAAGKSTLRVLGTKFNINAYPEEKYVEVVLEEGKVQFTAPSVASPIEMKPDERLVYTPDSVNISISEPFKYSAWTEGMLVFRGDPMAEVIRRIERWYNVDVELVDKQLENYVIRGIFKDDSLEDVFRYLAMTSPIKYRILGRKALCDGTSQKPKVFLYKKNI